MKLNKDTDNMPLKCTTNRKSFYKELGRNIYKSRYSANLSQTDLAKHLGVSYQQVQKYESGENKPSLDKLFIISDVCNTPFHQFFTGISSIDDKVQPAQEAEETKQEIRETYELVKLYKQLPANVKKSTIKLLKSLIEVNSNKA